jgi:hypothetical protein
MKAVVYEDVRTVGVHDVPDATIETDSDAVVRVTSSALCGSDLHMYDGRTGATPDSSSATNRSAWWNRSAAPSRPSPPGCASCSPPTCTAAPARCALVASPQPVCGPPRRARCRVRLRRDGSL